MEFMNVIFGYAGEFAKWIAPLTQIVTAATAVTMLTPTNVDNKIVSGLLKMLNFLAGNFLKNKNADDVQLK